MDSTKIFFRCSCLFLLFCGRLTGGMIFCFIAVHLPPLSGTHWEHVVLIFPLLCEEGEEFQGDVLC
jgi:hypothetical protein